MTISRRRFMQAGAAMTAAGTSLGWALPALGKAQDVPVLMKEAEDLYARCIVVDMLADEVRDQEGLKFIKDSAVTCISTTLGVRRPEKENAQGAYMLNGFPLAAAVEDCAAWNRFIKDNSSVLAPARTTGEIRRAKQEGKQAVMLNFQNTPSKGAWKTWTCSIRLGCAPCSSPTTSVTTSVTARPSAPTPGSAASACR